MKKLQFEKKVQERRFQNQLLLQEQLWTLKPDDPLMLKIKNYSDRYGLSSEYVLEKLRYGDEDFILNGFEKDPCKQNIYEDLQLKFVKSIPVIKNAQKLPSGGKKAKFIQDGKIVSGADCKQVKGGMKSLDFYWHYDFGDRTLQFYTTTKYTKDDGGAQDNQRQDVISFLKEAKTIQDKDIFCIAIIDGDYYTKERDPISWKDIFNNQYVGIRSFAVESHELPDLIEIIICDWLSQFNSPEAMLEKNMIKKTFGIFNLKDWNSLIQ